MLLHFTDSKSFGGAEQVILTLLAGLDRQEWQPVLAHHAEPGLAGFLQSVRQLEVETWAVPRLSEGHKGLRLVPRFAGELRVRRPDVFHAHLTWPLACKFALLAAELARIPAVIATGHLYVDLRVNRSTYWQQRLVNAGLDRYIAVSEEVARKVRQAFGISRSKIQVIPNGIPVAQFDRPPNPARRAEIFGPTERPVVFTAARLDKQKGHQYLLEAVKQVPDALFALAGDGTERANLEVQADRLGISERVMFLGQRQDIPDLLANCDLVVLPSLYEGLPLSVLEAMAAGKPVIATAVGGTDEAIVNNESGFLVPPANPTALANAIKTMFSDQELAKKLEANGKARVKEKYSARRMTEQVTGLYEQVLSAKGR